MKCKFYEAAPAETNESMNEDLPFQCDPQYPDPYEDTCGSCRWCTESEGFPGESLTCCSCPGHEHILDCEFNESAVK